MTTLSTLKEKIESLNNELRTQFKAALKQETDKIFNKYPDLEAITWTQYTPYFNDGEPCEFSAHLDYPGAEFKGESYYEVEEVEEAYDGVKGIADEVTELTSSLYPFEDTLRRVLGEGKVYLYRDRIDVEEYDHD